MINYLNKFIHLYILIYLGIQISCVNNKEREIKRIVSEKIGTKINLIDSLRFFSLKEGWINRPSMDGIKLITYINGSCSSCIFEMSQWQPLFEDEDFKNIIFLFYVRTNNIEQTTALMQQIEFNHPIIIDQTDIFYTQNNLSEKKICQTFLLDQENKIMIIGNPIYGINIKNIYVNAIRNYHMSK